MMDVLIRRATTGDYKFISALSLALGYEFPEDRVKERIRDISERTADIILVADVGGEVVGYIHASPYELMFSEPVINIAGFVVDQNHRGRGIGRRLMTELERTAREHNFTGIRLTSAMHRAGAHRFYEAHGFYGKDVKLYEKVL
ncbi:MAG: GNAT family N-acetyltransferase [Oscillospiraceae bacterium]|nr:GNAT family N-acetyltransferase [Oscillospiraceae bacterium]